MGKSGNEQEHALQLVAVPVMIVENPNFLSSSSAHAFSYCNIRIASTASEQYVIHHGFHVCWNQLLFICYEHYWMLKQKK